MMNRSNDVAFQGQPLASPLSVFCAAAPTDEELLLTRWETYLFLLQQAHLISYWSTWHVDAGANIEQERSSHLDHADLILLLLSEDFFASKECLAIMQHALERQRAGSARVIPLLLHPVEWQGTELAALACLPANGVPVSQWTIQDEAWHACVLGLQPFLKRRLSVASLVFTSVLAQRRAASDRERILGRLRQTYQHLLDSSLYGIIWMELGLTRKQDAVRNASHLLLRLPEHNEQILPSGTSILHAYKQAQEELLILGAPGAGKSTLLLDLALQLVEHALVDETYPLPVILPLSSWAVRQPPLAAWLIEQCAHIYDVPKKLSQEWVEHEHILPLLDGLDEMEEIARPACIAAINIYHSEHLTPLVVCSRQSEYDLAANQERLALQSAVVVQPLADEHINASLRIAGPAFAGVQTALDQQPALRELATTPLMLSVLLLTYQGSSLEDIVQPGTDLLQQVWTDYVARMVRRKGSETR
ncbi:MAG TPA: TIR domain-containing protein, partial [Ktedonobacteraceae bacterium]|nr:TIR domain-containing protein [Ktedonobacteraceae bacterium]